MPRQKAVEEEDAEVFLDILGRKHYRHKYESGIPNESIPESEFEKAVTEKKYPKPLRDKSYLVALFWIGARKTEPLEMFKENIELGCLENEEEILLLNIPAKKFGRRGGKIQLHLSWFGVELIKKQWLKTKKGRKIWRMTPKTAYRIVKRAFPGKSPHHLRWTLITKLRKMRDQGLITTDDIKSWTGIRRDATIERYGLKTQAGIHKISEFLGSENNSRPAARKN